MERKKWVGKSACSRVFLLTETEIMLLPDRMPDTIEIANTRKIQDLFFPDKNDLESAEKAIAICSSCPVQLECLEYSLQDSQPMGIWGGTSGRTRRRIRRMRKIFQLSGRFIPDDEVDQDEGAESERI